MDFLPFLLLFRSNSILFHSPEIHKFSVIMKISSDNEVMFHYALTSYQKMC